MRDFPHFYEFADTALFYDEIENKMDNFSSLTKLYALSIYTTLIYPHVSLFRLSYPVTAFSCDFDQPVEEHCLYIDQPSQFNWTRLDRDTPSAETGPYLAASNDWYMYIEASYPRKTGDTAM